MVITSICNLCCCMSALVRPDRVMDAEAFSVYLHAANLRQRRQASWVLSPHMPSPPQHAHWDHTRLNATVHSQHVYWNLAMVTRRPVQLVYTYHPVAADTPQPLPLVSLDSTHDTHRRVPGNPGHTLWSYFQTRQIAPCKPLLLPCTRDSLYFQSKAK